MNIDAKKFRNLAEYIEPFQTRFKRFNYHDYSSNSQNNGTFMQKRYKLPSYLKTEHKLSDEVFDTVEAHATSVQDSLFHLFLDNFIDSYTEKNWNDKQRMVIKFKEYLSMQFEIMRRNKDDNLNLIKELDFDSNIITDEMKFFISRFFNVNIIVIDDNKTNLIFYEPEFQRHKAYIVMYETDDGIFSMIKEEENAANVNVMRSTTQFVSDLVDNFACKNHILGNLLMKTRKKGISDDLIEKVCNVNYKKLLLADLRKLAEKEGIDIKKKKKSELIAELMAMTGRKK